MFKLNDSILELQQIGMKYNHILNMYQRSSPFADYGFMQNSLIPATLAAHQQPFFDPVRPVLIPPSLSAVETDLPVSKTYLPFAEKYFPVANARNEFINTFDRPEISRMMQAANTVADLIPKSISPSVFQSPAFMEIQNISRRLNPMLETYKWFTPAEPSLNQEFTIDVGEDRANEISDLIVSSVPDSIEEKADVLQSLSNKMTPTAILALAFLLLESVKLVLAIKGEGCPQVAVCKEILDWLTKALEFYRAYNKKSPDAKEIDDGTGRFNQEHKG